VIGGARSHATRLGLTIVLDEPYPEDALSPALSEREREREDEGLTALVARLASLQRDLILGVGTTEADLAFAQELRRQHVQPAVVALVAVPIERFREVLGADADGFCGPSQWEQKLQGEPDLGPTSAQFSADFRARFDLEPDYPAAQAYAAGLVAARCAEIAASLNDDALRRVAATLDLTTCYGRFRLDPDTGQQVGHTMVVAQWQAGRKQIVWPASAATASLQVGSR
jgi:ABC-type branched-subunit amino acid transport system substrate-binding protein